MKINVKIDRISIQVDGGEEMWFTLEAARELQRDLNNILGPDVTYRSTSKNVSCDFPPYPDLKG